MANPDLAAPNAAILPNRRFSCPFAGLQAQPQPVAEIVQCGEADGNKAKTARRLGLTRTQLHVRLRKYAIEPPAAV